MPAPCGGAGTEAINEELDQAVNSTGPAAFQPRPYQNDTIARVRAAVREGARRVLIVAPTGSGKTVIASEIIARAASTKRALFLAHRRELISQAVDKLVRYGVDPGVILAGVSPRPGQPCQVASVQTLWARAMRSRRMDMPGADVVIVDEAHHVRAESYQKIIDSYPGAVILGLTATPCRGDGRGLGNAFDAMVEAPDIAELTKAGYLVPAVCYAPHRPDLSGVHTRQGDYVESELAEIMDTGQITGDVVEHWLRLGRGRKTIVFAVNVRHSTHLRDEFCRAGIYAEHLDASTPSDERERILRDFATGAVEVVCNVGILTEGYDAPAASCLILARPTKSLGLYRQMIGRVLRPLDGKADALILDHAGAVFMHGLPDDKIAWTLDSDKRATNTAQSGRSDGMASRLTECPECRAIRLSGRPCPACGWRPTPRAEAVEVVEGELARVDRLRRTKSTDWPAADRHNFYRMLAWIAQDRRYQPGWARHKFKEKFGDWPMARHVAPLEPDEIVTAWVRSRDIAYAKAKEAERRRGAA